MEGVLGWINSFTSAPPPHTHTMPGEQVTSFKVQSFTILILIFAKRCSSQTSSLPPRGRVGGGGFWHQFPKPPALWFPRKKATLCYNHHHLSLCWGGGGGWGGVLLMRAVGGSPAPPLLPCITCIQTGISGPLYSYFRNLQKVLCSL